jgi:hypothetical protein
MRCPIARASARFTRSGNNGGEQEEANPSPPIEQPQAPVDVPHDEVMTAVSDDQVSCNARYFIYQ